MVEGNNFVDAFLAKEYAGTVVYLDRRHTSAILRVLEVIGDIEVSGTLCPKPSAEEIRHYIFRVDNFSIIEKMAWKLKN